MSDRELLELAAKAAWMTIHAANQAQRDACGAGDAGLWISNDTTCWNPLADDGDALRLAVKCGIEIWPDREAKEVVVGFCIGKGQNMVGLNFSADFEDDEMAATRLAIVRAAAQIGDAIRTGGPVWPMSIVA